MCCVFLAIRVLFIHIRKYFQHFENTQFIILLYHETYAMKSTNFMHEMGYAQNVKTRGEIIYYI